MKSICVTDKYGSKRWRNDKGQLHREDGPAIEYAGVDRKCWFINGKCHREDGPAIEYGDGQKAYYYHGKIVDCDTDEEFFRLIKLKVFW